MLKEFREFAMRGNVVDLAVGLILGAAFGAIVTSFVNDVVMPPIGMLLGGVDFSNLFVLLKAGAKAAPPYATLRTPRPLARSPSTSASSSTRSSTSSSSPSRCSFS